MKISQKWLKYVKKQNFEKFERNENLVQHEV